jgi:hypothetical protein
MKLLAPRIARSVHMIIRQALIAPLILTALCHGTRPDLLQRVPILPDTYGPLSLVNGMMFWEAQIPHLLLGNHRTSMKL